MNISTSVTTLLLLAASATAGTSGHAVATSSDQPWSRTFRSVAVTEHGQPRDLLPGTRLRLVLHNGGLTAHADCSDLVGNVAVENGLLTVTGLRVWRNDCTDNSRYQQDLWLAAFLDGDPAWRLDGDGADLVLTRGATEIRLTDRPTVAIDPALVDTYWVLESVVEGEAGHPLPPFPQPYLIVHGTGEVEAYNGCNWLSGTVTVAGDALTLSGMGTTKRNCGWSNFLLEMKIDAALDDGTVTARIEAGRLDLTRPDGPGLRLRSES